MWPQPPCPVVSLVEVSIGLHLANRNYPSQRLFGFHMLPVRLDCSVAIGSSGAPTIASTVAGIASITRLSTGVYRLQLADNYYSFLNLHAMFQSPVSGSNVADGSFSTNSIYQITAVGTTNWANVGLPSGLTAAVGMIFKASGAGGAGSGTAKVLGASGIYSVEVIGSGMLNNQPAASNSGGYIVIQCLGPTDATHTAQIPVDPASGSTMILELWMNNSSIQ